MAAAIIEATKIIVTYAVNAIVDWFHTQQFPNYDGTDVNTPWRTDRQP
jgi:hypothetical protein